MTMSVAEPLISVIVPTYNRARELPRLIRALQGQSFPEGNFEVLVVDDGSTDGTRQYLEGLQPRVRCLVQEHGGASRARNLGARQARGRILAFTDDDCIPDSGWLHAIHQSMIRHQDRVALLGHTYSEYPSSTFVHSVFKNSEPVVTCNFAVAREAFKTVGGFDEHFVLYFEDEDLGLRLIKSGYAICYEPAMRVLHPSRYQSFPGFLRLRSGLQYLCYMSQKHPEGDHWKRHRQVLRQVQRKALLFGAPLLAAFFWPPLLVVPAAALLAHFSIDGWRAWRHRRGLRQMGFEPRTSDLLAFTFLTWSVPFLDAIRILQGCLRDRGRTAPWEAPVMPERADAVTRFRPAISPRKPSARLRRYRTLIQNPAVLWRKASRRIILRLPHRTVRVVSIGNVRMELDLNDDNMRSMYLEWYETEEVQLIRGLVHPGQTAIDVGANVGYITAVIADTVGPTGQVHSLEPVPAYYRKLAQLARLNPNYRIHPLPFAAGDTETELWLHLSSDNNIGWNTLVVGPEFGTSARKRIRVRVRPLDAYLAEAQPARVDFIKIDAEGFEFPILKGLQNCLSGHRPPVLCEVVPEAYPLLGCCVEDLEAYLRHLRYTTLAVDLQPIQLTDLTRTTNVLLLPQERAYAR